MEFKVGQRYTSHTEPDLGLGIVAEIDGRTVVISFPAAADTRAYSIANAPLSRIQYQAQDTIHTTQHTGPMVVIRVDEINGINHYQAEDEAGAQHQVPEWYLDPFIQITTAYDRLKSGQLSHPLDYQLRIETLRQHHRLASQPSRGLGGGRVQLLEHQVYIAHEVAKRPAPRVLLSDEVGLGKTIEAGMILHYLLHWGHATRVLVLVPDSLVHQWLVEMLRRFNLRFSIFDTERYQSLIEEGIENPFETEQCVLGTLSCLVNTAGAAQAAITAGWDCLVVDEAHHLTGPDETHTPDPQYGLVKQLTEQVPSVLLLTATPEQTGSQSHFARLHLLDSERYYDFKAFQAEDARYSQVRELINCLLDTKGNHPPQLTAQQDQQLQQNLLDPTQLQDPKARDKAVAHLLDTQGTGKAVFRNSRKHIQGFPTRTIHPYPLETPDPYLTLSPLQLLTPEAHEADEDWATFDTRVHWLTQWFKQYKHRKALLICHHTKTAAQLDKHLNLKAGIRSTAFYEGLSIVERDRAAAYFADEECGAQVLVCSEVGSEGRNFQFLQDLILFDLPQNPDLLEQRIGRLDRIGQGPEIHIHLPFFNHTAQAVLVRWYHEGLNQLAQSFSGGFKAYQLLREPLQACLEAPEDNARVDALIQISIDTCETLIEAQTQGRDALLEHHSCQPEIAQPLIQALKDEESQGLLKGYLQLCFDRLGVNYEDHSEDTWIISASEDLRIDPPTSFDPDGMTMTFNRDIALSREDFNFATFEHPLVTDLMHSISDTEFGNASVASISIKKLPAATLFLELWFCVQVSAPRSLGLDAYLPLSPTRFLMDVNGNNLANALAFEQLAALCEPIKKDVAIALVKRVTNTIHEMLTKAQTLMEAQLPDIKTKAIKHMEINLGEHINRLKTLQRVNPDIKESDINHIAQKIHASAEAIDHATLSLQGLKLMINTG